MKFRLLNTLFLRTASQFRFYFFRFNEWTYCSICDNCPPLIKQIYCKNVKKRQSHISWLVCKILQLKYKWFTIFDSMTKINHSLQCFEAFKDIKILQNGFGHRQLTRLKILSVLKTSQLAIVSAGFFAVFWHL